MTDLQKRRAALREKIEALEADASGILADVRDKKKTLDGNTRSRLEQINMDLEEARSKWSETEQELSDERLISDVESGLRYFKEPSNTNDSAAGTVRSTERENLTALRNSHPLFRDWTHSGDFFSAVAQRALGRSSDARLDAMYEQRAATQFGETVDQDGGVLVPPQFTATILQRTYEMGQILSRCRRIPMSSKQLEFPAVDETSRATGSRLGGVQAYWEGEGDAPTATKGKFSKVTLNARKLTAATHASDELLSDAPALAAWISMAFTEEMTFTLEDAIIRGDGSNKPLGILNAPCLVSVSKETNQAAASIVFENITKMRARMWGRSRPNSVWLNNQDIEPALASMSLAVGTGGIPVYLPAGGLADAPFDRLYGRPMIPVEYCSTLGTVGDLIYADFQQYLLGQRQGLQTATSIHVKFLENEQTFRFVLRVDGQPWWKSTLTPYKGSNALSPFVVLATRA